MKTVNIFFLIAGLALTGICSDQLFSQNNSDVLYYTAYYNPSGRNMEYYLNRIPARYASWDPINAPLVERAYYTPLEYDPAVEPWMTAPFESALYEEELVVEDWMTEPFESALYEEELVVEDWMTEPFECALYEEELVVEDWMTEPFESALYEEELVVEDWMTEPFESALYEEELVVEDWMTHPFYSAK